MTPEEKFCPDCGAPLPGDVLGGICPRCLITRIEGPLEIEADPPDAEVNGGARGVPRTAADECLESLEISGELGRGGMGVVYAAKDRRLERTVALKRLRPELAEDAGASARFLREARVASQLEHPGIVPVYDMGRDAHGQPFYTMRQIEGETLAAILDRLHDRDPRFLERYPLHALLEVFQKVCEAMDYAHSKRVIHRDLKPENIMVGKFGEAMVMDWGLAKRLDGDVEGENSGTEPFDGLTLETSKPPTAMVLADATQHQSILGTLGYMAPEQAGGQSRNADERADVYALGAILYAILALRPPIRGRDAALMLDRTTGGDIRPPTDFNPDGPPEARGAPLLHCPNGRVPSALSAVAMKALAVRPGDRHATVADLRRDLAAHQTGFLTSAEAPGIFKSIRLLMRRRKWEARLAAFGLVVPLLILAAFAVHVLRADRRVQGILTELTDAAPVFAEQAGNFVEKQQFELALARVTSALKLAPDNGDYHRLRGEVLQSLLRFEEARDAFAQAKSRNPGDRLAEGNWQLCDRLARENRGRTNPLLSSMKALAERMQAEKRYSQATALLKAIEKETAVRAADNKERLELCQRFAKAAGLGDEAKFNAHEWGIELQMTGPPLTNLARLADIPADGLWFHFEGLIDFEPLHRMPLLRRLDFNGTSSPLDDLSGLRGLRLTHLTLVLHRLKDLSPLRGKPLTILRIDGTQITDLSPLADMPLTAFMANGTPIRDLGPLRNSPLEYLELSNTEITDLSPIHGKPLRELHLHPAPLPDWSFVRNLPLRILHAGGDNIKNSDLIHLQGLQLDSFASNSTNLTDLHNLRGLPLTRLSLRGAGVRDLSPLAGMPLRELDLSGTGVTNLSPLRGARLFTLRLSSTQVEDLGPLRGLIVKEPHLELNLDRTPIRNIEPLRGLALSQLTLHGCTNLHDLSPIAACRELNVLTIPEHVRDIEFLRSLPKLTHLGRGNNIWETTAAEFWKAYDAQKAAEKK